MARPQSGLPDLRDSNDKTLDNSNSLHMKSLHVAAAGILRVTWSHTISIAPRCPQVMPARLVSQRPRTLLEPKGY